MTSGDGVSQVTGRILWCRQLLRKVEGPMLILRKKLEELKVRRVRGQRSSVTFDPSSSICQGPEMTKVIRSYNSMAAMLLQYEMLQLRGWSQTAERTPLYLSAALLVRPDNSKVLTEEQEVTS